MTELEQYQPTATVAPPSSIQQTALELTGAMQISNAICQSSFTPTHFRGKPEECAVAILYGATIGFDPVTAVQQIYVIGGKPALYSRAMVAVVLTAGHEIWTEDEGPGHVTVCGRRKGAEHIERVTWTTDMAKQAGYDKNAKYRNEPRSMLYARAAGDVARRIAPDALLGMGYNVEEMQLAEAVEGPRRAPATSTAKDTVRSALNIGGPSTPAAEPQPDARPAETPTGGITKAQSAKLHASFSELGITDRPERLTYAAKVVGHDLATSNELTKDEATQVIEALVVDLEQRRQQPAATAAAEPHDDGVVDAEVVRDAAEVFEEAVSLGAEMGLSRWEVETELQTMHDVKPGQATTEQVEQLVAAFKNGVSA